MCSILLHLIEADCELVPTRISSCYATELSSIRVNMANETLVAFSHITENFLYFKIGCNGQPRVRKCYVVKVVIYILFLFKMLRVAVINNDDISQQIQHGNFFIGFTLQTDLITAPSAVAVVEFATLMSYHIYLLRYRPQSLLFMTQVVGEWFESMPDNHQRMIIEVARLVMYSSRALGALFVGYPTYVVIVTFDTTLWQNLQVLVFAVACIYFAEYTIMICYVITVSFGMSCAYVVREISYVFRSNCVVQQLHDFNLACVLINKLNSYWKSINFLFVVGTALTMSLMMSVTFLYNNIPTLISVSYAVLVVTYSSMYLFVVLFAAYVHSKMKNCYNKLLHMSDSTRFVGPRIKLNYFVKKFERLRVFTLADVAPVTFDMCREVNYAVIMQLLQFFSTAHRIRCHVVRSRNQACFVSSANSLVML